MTKQQKADVTRNAEIKTLGFATLANDEDRELYHDYLKTNLLLWRDRFEEVLSTNLPEPTTPEYEQEKQQDTGASEEDALLEIINI